MRLAAPVIQAASRKVLQARFPLVRGSTVDIGETLFLWNSSHWRGALPLLTKR